jgi:hypothetical protein
MPNIFTVIAYLLFYGGIAVTLFLLAFAVFGIVKLAKKGSKYKINKKLFAAFTAIAGAVSVIIVGVFATVVIRFYALPPVTFAGENSIVLHGVTYRLTDKAYPLGATLKPIARQNLSDAVLTPGWAMELALRASYYDSDGQNTDYIYYAGMMGWWVYERVYE